MGNLLLVLTAFAALGGLLAGSFVNVVVWRLPRGESLLAPGSHCPRCTGRVRLYDNVPVLSWLALRGRCRDCCTQISARYPLVEMLCAVAAVGVVLASDGTRELLLGLALTAVLVPVALIDLDHRLIPNALTLAGALAALAIGFATDPAVVPEQLLAGVAAGGFLLVAALARPGGMGMGDVKLAAVLGLFLGWQVGVALMISLLAGTIVGLAVIARRGVAEGRRTALPFGPFLALGGMVALLVGTQLTDMYLRAFG